jgi:hypothetical protein
MCSLRLACAAATISIRAVADMIYLAFFFAPPGRVHREHKPRIIPLPSRGHVALRGQPPLRCAHLLRPRYRLRHLYRPRLYQPEKSVRGEVISLGRSDSPD